MNLHLKEIGYDVVEWASLAQKSAGAVSCEHSNEPLGSIQGGEFITQFSDHYLPHKDYSLWTLFH
jgi:hypothetical protein